MFLSDRPCQLIRMTKTTNSWAQVAGVCLVVWCLLRCDLFVDAQDAGIKFLDEKEDNVKQIALSAAMVDDNCNLLDKCQSVCSRAVCHPLKEDQKAECVRVNVNNICLPTEFNKSCDRFMKLNYERSYLTLPPPANPDQMLPEMARDICLYRALDITYKTISLKHEFSFVYFGAMSGIFRAFPGRDRMEATCVSFETRGRPWFKNGGSVQKQLRILVDTGNSMGSQVPPNYPPAAGKTFLEVTSNIIVQMLKTVSPDDFVDVGIFNSSGHHPLSPLIQITKDPPTDEVAEIRASVMNITRSLPGPPSNLTAAILNVVTSFKQTTSETLKVIVIFTDGQFAPLDAVTFPTQVILDSKVKIIVYKLPRQIDQDPFLRLTNLYDVLCNVKGTYELLEPHTTSNPLYSIRSFYTFLAQMHLAVAKNQSTWSGRYTSVSQALNGTTVTYPAFGKDGQLIGIAGIDVFPEQLDGVLRDAVQRALDNRSSMGHLPGTFADINFACSYQSAARVGEACSASVSNGGICTATDAETRLEDRVCCGEGCCGNGCRGVPLSPPNVSSAPGKSPGPDLFVLPIAFGTIVGVLVVVSVALMIFCYCCLSRSQRKEHLRRFQKRRKEGKEATYTPSAAITDDGDKEQIRG